MEESKAQVAFFAVLQPGEAECREELAPPEAWGSWGVAASDSVLRGQSCAATCPACSARLGAAQQGCLLWFLLVSSSYRFLRHFLLLEPYLEEGLKKGLWTSAVCDTALPPGS